MFYCPSRSSSARSSASASATRSPPRRERACGPPLGYRVEDRKLVVIDSEAETVCLIFRRYAELGSVRLLKNDLDARGINSKARTSASGRRTGGKPLARLTAATPAKKPEASSARRETTLQREIAVKKPLLRHF